MPGVIVKKKKFVWTDANESEIRDYCNNYYIINVNRLEWQKDESRRWNASISIRLKYKYDGEYESDSTSRFARFIKD